MAQEKKMYRLIRGTHYMPNPSYNPEKPDSSIPSHVNAQTGDLVPLNDEQYASFKDKFVPVGVEASDVRDELTQKLDDAKVAAMLTKEDVDPNKPLEPKVAAAVAAVNAAKAK